MTIDWGSSSDNLKTSISLSSGSSGSRNIFSDWRYSRHRPGGFTRQGPFHLLLSLPQPNKRRWELKSGTLFPTLKCLILIRLSCHLSTCSLVELGAVVSLLPPFIQFSPLDLPFYPSWLEIHFPPLNRPVGFELKFNWYMASVAIDQLIQC